MAALTTHEADVDLQRVRPDVEIVVPVFNEAAQLADRVTALRRFLDVSFPFRALVTVVDNASTDDTYVVASQLAATVPGVAVMHLPRKGRGYALREAWSVSRAPVVAYMDVDLSTSLDALLPLVAPLLSGQRDVMVGSRLARGAEVVRGPKRELISRCYNVILKLTLRGRFSDAQCGFKALRRDAAERLLPFVEDNAWFFDTELLVTAERLGLRVGEVPVHWVDDPDSRVDIVATATDDLRGVWRMLRHRPEGVRPARGREATADQLLRFAGVGAVSTLGYLFLFVAWRPALGPLWANAVALAIATLFNTVVHRELSHTADGQSRRGRLLAVGGGLYAVSLALTTVALLAVQWLAPAALLPELVAVTVRQRGRCRDPVHRPAVLDLPPERPSRRRTHAPGGVPMTDLTTAPDAPIGVIDPETELVAPVVDEGVPGAPSPGPVAAWEPHRGPVGRFFRGKESDPVWARPGLLLLLGATAVLYFWDLGINGWANSFYSAAVQAGSQSWKAFFFGSSDASNFITVDKPPFFLWPMEISVRIFGLHSWSILAPQAAEGVATVGLVYLSVRRWFSAQAALLGGAVVALTPVAAMMFRFNNPDAMLALLLTGATYATIRALERAQTRWMVLAGTLVGLGFITKMMQAFIIIPVLAVVYLLAAPTGWWRRVWQVVVMGVATLVAAGWWVAIVALTPAADRPYIGGSQNNSILNLIFGYNGFGRITGNETGSVGGGAPAGGGGMWGSTGITRLFTADFGNMMSWLLPGALVMGAVVLVLTLRARRTDRERAAILVWGGSLVCIALVISLAKGIIHPYYTVALAPPLGALVGITTMSLWQRRASWAGRIGLAAGLGATVIWSDVLLGRTSAWVPALRPFVVVAGALGVIAILALPCAALGAQAGRRPGGLPRAERRAGRTALLHGGHGGRTAQRRAAQRHPDGGGWRVRPGPRPSRWLRSRLRRDRHRTVSRRLRTHRPGRDRQRERHRRLPRLPGRWHRHRHRHRRLPRLPGRRHGHGHRPRRLPRLPGPRYGHRHRRLPRVRTGRPGRRRLPQRQPVQPGADQALASGSSRFTWAAAAVNSNNAAGYQLASGEPIMAIGGFNGSDPAPTLTQFETYVAEAKIHYFIAGGGGLGGGVGGRGGSNDASQITSWVESHFTAKTVGGVTVYDLTSRSS